MLLSTCSFYPDMGLSGKFRLFLFFKIFEKLREAQLHHGRDHDHSKKKHDFGLTALDDSFGLFLEVFKIDLNYAA